jgi:hypothetical protein
VGSQRYRLYIFLPAQPISYGFNGSKFDGVRKPLYLAEKTSNPRQSSQSQP